jgi:hypothetical protein
MTTPPERRDRIARIAALPDALAAVVAGLSDADLDTRVASDPWTIRQVTHHIADSHMNAFIRMKLMLTEQHPTLKPYDQDAWAHLADTAAMPVDATLALLGGLHARWVRLLESLGDADCARSEAHPENSEVTIDSMLITYSDHGEEHVAQIGRIRAAMAGRP